MPCKLTESVKLINFFGSIFTLTAMAIDRYILICKSKVELMRFSKAELSLIKSINRKSVPAFEIVRYWLLYVWLFGVVMVFIFCSFFHTTICLLEKS